jgi:L-alanine-DL-glutamate epimerase-like enolase superfamily enzyme
MEEIREVRKAVGDEFVLMHDPVQRYNRFEAMTVGRLLDELNYAWFEDPDPHHRSGGPDPSCARP